MGRVYWITGFSGAGKTTVGKLLYEKLKTVKDNIVFLDGDTLRQVFGDDLGYGEEDRKKCAMRYSRICRLLSGQGIDVICCTISMYDSVREWNRKNIPDYFEVYVRVDMDVLVKRDQKGLYSGTSVEDDTRLVGVSLSAEVPKSPDIILDNNGELTPGEQVALILEKLGMEL
ncbi:MAG: adenylyl-sulfate kinase [Lachnospiraceae bacterium]|nr:adenylyl-sulfate kinase [Lachnospiraceae bacterium]